MGYANIQADSNFYRQSLNADGVKYVTGPYTSLYEDVFRAVTVTTDSVVSVTSYVGDSLSSQFLLAGTEIYGLFSSVTIHSGNAVLHLAGASYISEIINQYSATGIPLGFYEEGTQCLSQKISALLTQGVFDDASWVMVPSQYKEDTVRAFKPTSELGNLAFTRSSDATFTDSTGVVRRSPWNLVTFSEQFDNAIWGRSATTVSINSAVAPNGTLTADTLTADGTNTFHGLTQVGNSINGVTYTQSIYAKRSTNNFIQIVGTGAIYTSGIVFANFDLLNGTLGSSGGGAVSTITNVGNGWYRCTMTATATATGSGSAFFANIIPSATSARAESSTLTTSVFVWGAQLVEGTSALPYFATTDRLNVPRLDYRNADGTLSTCPRLLLEPQRTNSIRNSSMVGAVAGTPGTTPTNWDNASMAGLTRTVVGIGTENGLPYIDLRFNGTASSTVITVWFETVNQIAATTGQTWTNSVYAKLISGSALGYQLTNREQDASGVTLRTGSISITPTSTLQRFTYTRTNDGVGTAFVRSSLWFTLTNGATYDFTIRIAAPQMELGAYATTWVPTTTAAVTRLADTASKTGVSSLIGQTEGTMFADVNLDTRQSFSYFLITPNLATPTSYIGIGILNNIIQLEVVNSGVQASITFTNTSAGRFKIAAAYKQNDFAFYVNGTLVGTDTSGTVPACSALNLFVTGSNIQPLQYNQAALFPVRLDNTTLAALTTL